MSRKIPVMDLMWLLAETQASPIHVCGLMLFDKPKGRPRIVHEIVERYRQAEPTPPFDCIPDLLGTRAPQWRPAPHYNPRYHVQHIALPAGSRYEDLLHLVGDLHETMLDRERPLFRVWLIDQVPGRRFALFVKMHHAIIDGVSAAHRINASFSTARRRAIPAPLFAVDVPVRKPRPPKALVQRMMGLSGTAANQSMALLTTLRKGIWNKLGGDPKGSVPFAAHRGPLNQPVQNARSVATLSLPLARMREVGRRFGATLNDVAMTVIDAGVHRYLSDSGRAFEHRLVAMCPVSLRERGDGAGGTKVSAVFVKLGRPDAGPLDRLAQIVDSMNSAKQDVSKMSREAALGYAATLMGMAGLSAVTHADRLAPPSANLVISNVPELEKPLFLNGAPLVGAYPVSAIAVGVGLNATVVSSNDRMDFGFVANGSSLRNLPLLAQRVDEAWQRLEAAVP